MSDRAVNVNALFVKEVRGRLADWFKMSAMI